MDKIQEEKSRHKESNDCGEDYSWNSSCSCWSCNSQPEELVDMDPQEYQKEQEEKEACNL